MQPFLQPDICLIGRCVSFQEAVLICIALFDIITFQDTAEILYSDTFSILDFIFI